MPTIIRISDKLVKEAKRMRMGRIEKRSLTWQIEYWAQIGKVAEENPDLPDQLISDIIIGIEEINTKNINCPMG